MKLNGYYRTHTCAELRKEHEGIDVKLCGWVHRKRDHGGILFIDLRDHYGITQLVLSNVKGQFTTQEYDQFCRINNESIIIITGKVVIRTYDTVNDDLPTGMIEVIINSLAIESEADSLPISVNSDQQFPEDLRYEYRFLDLRREKLHSSIMLRSAVIWYLRKKMHEAGFNEFQTPILTASSPEGARDFLVPSRLNIGKFYALPQAPQQFKQMLMASGFDRYFQIAPCFRDEDGRSDRATGDFYQLDIEMSFVTQEEIFTVIEPIIAGVFREFSNYSVTNPPFPRIKYSDSMIRYGSDKPDLRNPIEISDVTNIFVDSSFSIFAKAIKNGSIIRAIPAPKAALKSRSFFDNMILFAQTECTAQGLAYIIFDNSDNPKGPIAKFLSKDKLLQLRNICSLSEGDAVFFVCEVEKKINKITSAVRIKLGEELNLITKDEFRFCWITDYPIFEWDEDKEKISFSHNPFSMPQGGIESIENARTIEEKLALRAYQYDIVCNGYELSSGAIRNHIPELMYKLFAIAGYTSNEVDVKFGGLAKAFKYGTPPHGGLAPGIDRIVMLLANEKNLREVIAFPMNQKGQDLLMNAPRDISQDQLEELGITLCEKKVKK